MAIAVEVPCDAHAFGMIATETGIDSENLFKTVDEPDRCQFMRAEPGTKEEKPSDDQQEDNADARQSREGAGQAQRSWLICRR